jgi:TRAP-type C4-dicarboxylate transport system permease small subunit
MFQFTTKGQRQHEQRKGGQVNMDDTAAGRLVHGLAMAAAIAGGCALSLVTLVTVVSVIGRALIPLGLGAIPGDFEMVQAGVLFAVFAFMPWCHLKRGHAIVAIVTDTFPVRLSAIAEFIWDVAMLVAANFIAWRLWFGLIDKFGNRESTFILHVPLWIVYTGGMIGAVAFVIVAIYCVARSGQNALSAAPAKPVSGTAE